jgi:hypothetical protein
MPSKHWCVLNNIWTEKGICYTYIYSFASLRGKIRLNFADRR